MSGAHVLNPGTRITGTGKDQQGRVRLAWTATLSYEPTTGTQGWLIAGEVDGDLVEDVVVLPHDATREEVARRIASLLTGRLT